MIKNLIKPILKFYKDGLDLTFSNENEFNFFHKFFAINFLFVCVPFTALIFIGSIAFITYYIPWVVLSVLVIFGILSLMTLWFDKYYKKKLSDDNKIK